VGRRGHVDEGFAGTAEYLISRKNAGKCRISDTLSAAALWHQDCVPGQGRININRTTKTKWAYRLIL